MFSLYLSTGLRPVFITCTAVFLSEVTVHCLLHGFLDTHLFIHSWCDIARDRSAPLSEDEDDEGSAATPGITVQGGAEHVHYFTFHG